MRGLTARLTDRRPGRYLTFGAAAVLLAACLGSAAPALASAQSCGGTGATTALTGTLADGASYEIQCPAGGWNGTLFLYSHGYVEPGAANPAQDASDPVTAGWLLGHGYAIAGSSYASTGWAVAQALPDQAATVQAFAADYGHPAATIAWGESLGGMITAGLVQRYPRLFSAALPMCGVLSGGVATWNTALDSEFAFQQLVDPAVQAVNITDPTANLENAIGAAEEAQQTPQGRARIALAAALGDTPGWFTPLSAEPAATDYSAQEQNQLLWDTEVDFPFVFAFRAELEARAGGNVSWTTGVNFASQLRKSADYREVVSLYQQAGLSLSADLSTLQHATPVSADPAAVSYLRDNITYNGQISVPVLTVHTIGDGLVVPENEQAYASVVDRAGNGRLLRQIFVARAGHCAFTPAETITAMGVLLQRLRTGRWDSAALQPASLNAAATALGPQDNIYASGSTTVATAPAFASFQPTPYLRPYDSWGRYWVR